RLMSTQLLSTHDQHVGALSPRLHARIFRASLGTTYVRVGFHLGHVWMETIVPLPMAMCTSAAST
ncbi:hypothetical protein A2U01_0069253, partial [Trifolium medium]|nr:hypothetical protein [Trifolium medium]